MTPEGAPCSLGNESGSHLEGISLLLLDAGKTVLCSLASLVVGHAENVVSLDSAVNTGVAGDGLTEHEALWLLADAVEGGDSLVVVLVSTVSNGIVSSWLRGGVVNLGVFATEESVNGCWGNWLLQNYFKIAL
jgi:hypothetical protein